MVRRTSVISKVFYQLLLNPDNPFRQLASSLCLRGPSMQMHWMGSLPGAQDLPAHRGGGSTRSPGPVLHWKPQGPGQCCCPGSEPAAAPGGLAGALPELSCSSSSPGTSCLSHQPNTATLPGSEEGRWIASMLTWDFPNISGVHGMLHISKCWFQFLFPLTSLEDKKLHRWCLLGL